MMKRHLFFILLSLVTLTTLAQTISTPATQCSNVTITNITTNSIKVSWSSGSGTYELVVLKPSSSVVTAPNNANIGGYSANTVYGFGTNIGNSNYVIYKGSSGNSVTITGLIPNFNYEAIVYSYNYGCLQYLPITGCVSIGYLMNTNYSSGNSEQHYSLAAEPTVAPTLSVIGIPAATTATLGFNGSSTWNMVYIYNPSKTSFNNPLDGTYYSPSTVFGNGSQVGGVGTYNHAVYSNSANNTVNVTNLTPATAYYALVYSYNGSGTSVNNGYNYYNGYDWVYFSTYNTPPTINSFSSYTVCQNAPTTTVNLSSIGDGSVIETQTVSIAAYSSNTSLMPNPTVNYTHPNSTGTLTFKPNIGQSGTSVITVVTKDGGPNNGATTRTFTVTVLPIPANAGSITTTSTTICQQKNGVLFSVPSIAYANNYNWSLPSGANIVLGANTNSILVNFNTSATTGLVSVYGSNPFGCGNGASSSMIVNFDKVPTTAFAGANQQICNNLTALAANAPTIGTGAWSYCSTGLGSISSPSTPNANLQVTNNSTVTSVWTISNGVCPASSSTVVVTNIFGSPSCNPNADFLTSNTSPCVNTPVIFYNTSVGATSSSWFFGPTATPSVSSASGSVSVVYASTGPKTVTLTINSVGGPDTEIKTAYVNVITAPVAPSVILGNTSICQGKIAEPYFINTVADASSYSWTFPSGVIQNTGGNTNAVTANFSTTATSGTIGVKAINTCGSSSVALLNVTVNPLPSLASSISGSNTVCQGLNSVVYVANNLNNGLSYTWNVPTGATIIGGLNTRTITVNYDNSAVSGTMSVYGTNGCGDGSVQNNVITVNPLPDAAGLITGSSSNFVCPLSTNINYSISPIDNATSYNWVYPNGYTLVGGMNTNSINLDATTSAQNGNIKVVAINACGHGDTSLVLPVSVAGIPAQQLCVVTVDDVSSHNEIIWQRNGVSNIDSFRVYRVKTSQIDTLIGTVAFTDLGKLVDPNSNPNVTSYTYKVAALDFCGNEGPKSLPHQSIHLQTIYTPSPQKMDLFWNTYSGAVVDYYRVLRDTNNTGNWEVVVNNLAPNVTSYTDFGISTTANSVRHRVDVIWVNSCDPTAKVAQSIVNTSQSNTKDFVISIPTNMVAQNALLASVALYPNPVKDVFEVAFTAGIEGFEVEVYNQLGSKLQSKEVSYTDRTSVDISELSSGVYMIVIKTPVGAVTKRISKL